MMRWYEDIDGNFVEQFQTTGFNARVWELYLFAALTEANLRLERPDPAPDFLAVVSMVNLPGKPPPSTRPLGATASPS